MEVITVEDLRPEHFELVAGWLSRPETNQWLTGEWRGRVATSVVVAMAVRNRKNRLFLVRFSGQACGLTALADIDTADRTAMLWYVLGEHTLSGRGIMLAAVKQLAHLSFEQLGLASLYVWVMADNMPSLRMIQKAGFREAGRIRCAACSAGRQVDRIYFDLLPGELH
jgi:RimJ/RimL family protein N-acetyltransferase